MPIGNKLTDRYEVKQTLGQGQMGVVYWAYDTVFKRDVSVKTIRDTPKPAAPELFYKECNMLLAEALQKGMRNEPIASFDSARILPRIERAGKALEAGDLQFASKILTELESEGHLVPEMWPLRRKIGLAERQKMLSQITRKPTHLCLIPKVSPRAAKRSGGAQDRYRECRSSSLAARNPIESEYRTNG